MRILILMAAALLNITSGNHCIAETNRVTTNIVTRLSERPAEWAVKIVKPGLPNLHQVTTNLYRGAQPTAEGMAQLQAMGVKTVFNLRSFNSDKKKLRATDLKPARLHLKAWRTDDEDVIQFLKIVTDTNNFPVFVHCAHGADRTGLMCAMYRIVVCDWSKQQAIEEMTKGDFNFHTLWRGIVPYIQKADIEKIKREMGLMPAIENKKARPL